MKPIKRKGKVRINLGGDVAKDISNYFDKRNKCRICKRNLMSSMMGYYLIAAAITKPKHNNTTKKANISIYSICHDCGSKLNDVVATIKKEIKWTQV